MTGTKTVAERLREIKTASLPCRGDILAFALGRKLDCPIGEDCINCIGRLASEMADTIEAEKTQAVSKALIEEVAKPENIGIGLLRDVAKELEEYAQMIEGATSEDLSHYAWLIRNALNGAKPQLPEGVIWPTYEDGELVKFGDEFIAPEYGENEPQKLTRLVLYAEEHFPDGTEGALWDANYLRPGGAIGKDYRLKRPEPEVLDADGVPIKVGDTVWHEGKRECLVKRIYRQIGDTLLDLNICGSILSMKNVKPAEVTHRKPDTQEAINHDAALLVSESFFDQRRDEFEDRVFDLLERQRKLLGGD